MLILANEADFDEVFDIMTEAFPPDEHRPYEAQRALLQRDCYKLYVEKQNGSVVGFIAVWTIGTPFVEHLAVDSGVRGGGLGGKILDEALAIYKNACLEVEKPETEIAKRRIAFYERHGFCLNLYPYEQPSLHAGQDSVPLYVMTYGKPLDGAEFSALKSELYTKVYEKRSGE